MSHEEASSNVVREEVRAIVLAEIGHTLVSCGSLEEAESAFAEALELHRALASKEPTKCKRLHELSLAFDRLADVSARRGELDRGIDAYTEMLTVQRRLSAAEPARGDWARALSLGYNKVGDLQQRCGDFPAALVSFSESRRIAEKLVQSDPSNLQWQRDLSVCHDRLGSLQQARGDLTAALVSFSESLSIAETLVQSDPSNLQWQRDLGICHDRLGCLQQARGDLPAALRSFGVSRSISETLVQSDPSNAQWQRDWGISYDRLGCLQQARGDESAALMCFAERRIIAERLAHWDPSNRQYLRDLAISYDRLGCLQQAQGDLSAALESFGQSLMIAKCLALSKPNDAKSQRELSISYDRLGCLQQAHGDLSSALLSFTESRDISQSLVQWNPTDARCLRDLSISYDRLGDWQRTFGDSSAALHSYTESRAISARLVQSDPSNEQWWWDLALSDSKRRDVREAIRERQGRFVHGEFLRDLVRSIEGHGFHPVLICGRMGSGKSSLLCSLIQSFATDVEAKATVPRLESLLSPGAAFAEEFEDTSPTSFRCNMIGRSAEEPNPLFIPLVVRRCYGREMRFAFFEMLGMRGENHHEASSFSARLDSEFEFLLRSFSCGISMIYAAPMAADDASTETSSPEDRSAGATREEQALLALMHAYKEQRMNTTRDSHMVVFTKWDCYKRARFRVCGTLSTDVRGIETIIPQQYSRLLPALKRLCLDAAQLELMVYSATSTFHAQMVPTEKDQRSFINAYPRILWHWLYDRVPRKHSRIRHSLAPLPSRPRLVRALIDTFLALLQR